MMKRLFVWLIVGVTLLSPELAFASQGEKTFGVGIKLSNSSHLNYPTDLWNQITFNLVYSPIERIQVEPILGYRNYDIIESHVEILTGYQERKTNWQINSMGLGLNYIIPLKLFDAKMGAQYLRNKINSTQIISESVNGELESGEGVWDKYSSDSYFIKLGIGKTIMNRFEVSVEGGYRLSRGTHESRVYGELEDNSQGLHFGLNVVAMIF